MRGDNWGFRNLFIVMIFVFHLSTGSVAFADCRPMRLDSPGGSMERIHPYDQENLDICYAVTAAQMVDAWNLSHGAPDDGFRTDALDIAMNHKFAAVMGSDIETIFRKVIGEGGLIEEALDYLFIRGACDRLVISEMLKSDSPYLALSELFQAFKAMHRAPSVVVLADSCSGTELKLGTEVLDASLPSVGPILDHLILAELSKLKEALEKSCSKKRRELGDDLAWNHHHVSGLNDLVQTVEKRFSAGSAGTEPIQPIGIAYCSNFLALGKEGYRLITRGASGEVAVNVLNVTGCESHVSVLIGQRRKADGGCQYLIQDSYGESCKGYSPAWECEAGKIWVDAEALDANTKNIVWIEEED